MNDCLQRHLSLVTSAATKEDVFERACFQNQPPPENSAALAAAFGLRWQSDLPRRSQSGDGSGDSAFAG
jgi:hypothetical protein